MPTRSVLRDRTPDRFRFKLWSAYAASRPANEIVLRTPFGEAHLPRPELPKPPHVPHINLQELQPTLQRLSEASSRSQEQMRRVLQSVAHWQAELGKSAKLMFDEGDELWDECLHTPMDKVAPDSSPAHDAPEAQQPHGQDQR